METKKVKKTFFCGKCHKEYTLKQNLLKHYKKIKTKCEDSKSFIIKENVCFNDPGPRVWDTNLEKAIKRHGEQVKLSSSANSFFKVQQTSFMTYALHLHILMKKMSRHLAKKEKLLKRIFKIVPLVVMQTSKQL